MKFSNVIFDDTLDSLQENGSIFKAAVAGVYKFSLFLSLDISNGYEFEIEAQVNGEGMQKFEKNSNEQEFVRSETFQFDFQLILAENDMLRNVVSVYLMIYIITRYHPNKFFYLSFIKT